MHKQDIFTIMYRQNKRSRSQATPKRMKRMQQPIQTGVPESKRCFQRDGGQIVRGMMSSISQELEKYMIGHAPQMILILRTIPCLVGGGQEDPWKVDVCRLPPSPHPPHWSSL